MERANAFQFKISCTLVGPELKAGDKAPAFQVMNNDLATVESSAYAGKLRIISSIPSLETGVCDSQTRKFNQAATELGENVVVLTISADLPFTQKRWCGAAGVDRVITLSDQRDRSFAPAYGTYAKELGICSRAVFVVDANDTVLYAEYVPVGGQEPNYDAVLAAVRSAQ